MSLDILGTSWDQCVSMVQYCFTSTETIRLVRTESPGRPLRLSHNLWTPSYLTILCVICKGQPVQCCVVASFATVSKCTVYRFSRLLLLLLLNAYCCMQTHDITFLPPPPTCCYCCCVVVVVGGGCGVCVCVRARAYVPVCMCVCVLCCVLLSPRQSVLNWNSALLWEDHKATASCSSVSDMAI